MSLETVKTFGRVEFSLNSGIAVLRINNPPVNAGSIAVRDGLVQALSEANLKSASGAVILGAGRCFVAGSDLREFGQPLQSPELPDVIRAIEEAPFPIVAALHGVALGGGLELALGCDYRFALADTKLGLPEVSLGFVPGAGGTQRLPRHVGVAKAIEMICASSRIQAQDAFELGLVDAVADGDLLDSAITFLGSADRPKRPAREMLPPLEDAADIDVAASKALKRSKGRFNVTEAIRLTRLAAEANLEPALAEERAVFQSLRLSDDAFALRHLFFAERQAGFVDGLELKNIADVKSVGVVGGGTMGQGIARAFLAADLPVTIVEQDNAALERTREAISGSYDSKVKRGRLTLDAANQIMELLEWTTDLKALSDCDLVIEAVFENMEVKKTLLSDLEGVLSTDAVIATNTSYLDIDEMAAGLTHPDRVIGLHFFSPADAMKLLEIVRADKTSDTTLAKGLKLTRKLGKKPVVARVAEGFIGNRIYAAYRRRAELLVLDGTKPEDVDKAITDFGFAMGPFAVSDLSGLDVAWAMRKRQAGTRDPKARYVTIADQLCEAGYLGRKSGKGWYDYSDGSPRSYPEVFELIETARAAAGIVPQAYSAEAIQNQLMAAIVNEAACVLDEGVAQRPSDIDVTFTNGYGFPRWRGGPLYWASQQNQQQLNADLKVLADAVGHDFKAGPVVEILNQLNAEKGA